MGRRACVVTIDPAKRLADALGLDELTNEPHQVDGDWRRAGRAVGPHARHQDHLRRRRGPQRRIAGAGGGHPRQPSLPQHLGRPRRHPGVHGDGEAVRAAPGRALRPGGRRHPAHPARPGFPRRPRPADPLPRQPRLPPAHDADPGQPAGARAWPPRLFLRTVSKVVGRSGRGRRRGVLRRLRRDGAGLPRPGRRVEELLVDGTTAFVVVASPRRDAVDEALFFADRLRLSLRRVEALVVNRVFPDFGPVPCSARPQAATETPSRGPRPPTWPTWTASPAENSNTSTPSPSACRARPSSRSRSSPTTCTTCRG